MIFYASVFPDKPLADLNSGPTASLDALKRKANAAEVSVRLCLLMFSPAAVLGRIA
jgi:hypothetical protein